MTTAIAQQKTPNDLPAKNDDLPVNVYPEIARLTQIRRQILVSLVTNMVSKERKTDTALAIELGINRSSIIDSRRNPLFADLLARLTVDVIKGHVDKVVGNLFNIAETNVKANEILLRISEVYKPTQRIMSQNTNLSVSTAYASGDDMVTAFLDKVRAGGYTLDRITALWNSL